MGLAIKTTEYKNRLNKTVAEVMHTGVISCPFGTPIPDVAHLMTKFDVSAIPVVDDGGYLAGIITRTDLVTLRGYNDYWRELKAEDVMVHDISTITVDEGPTMKRFQPRAQGRAYRIRKRTSHITVEVTAVTSDRGGRGGRQRSKGRTR